MSLKALNPLLGERRGRAQLAGGERDERPAGRFDDFGDPLEPALSGTGSAKRTRSMAKPGRAAIPQEYWLTPGMR